MKLKFPWQIFEKYWNIKIHENPSSESRLFIAHRRTAGQTDVTKLIVTFRNFYTRLKTPDYFVLSYSILLLKNMGFTWRTAPRLLEAYTKIIFPSRLMLHSVRVCINLPIQKFIDFTSGLVFQQNLWEVCLIQSHITCCCTVCGHNWRGCRFIYLHRKVINNKLYLKMIWNQFLVFQARGVTVLW
jgi:hypothetical protein